MRRPYVVIEAEEYDRNVTRGGKGWSLVSDPKYRGSSAMQATPTTRLTMASPGCFVLPSPLASRKNEMISITKPNSEACSWTQ